jgi:hypothetical protein
VALNKSSLLLKIEFKNAMLNDDGILISVSYLLIFSECTGKKYIELKCLLYFSVCFRALQLVAERECAVKEYIVL